MWSLRCGSRRCDCILPVFFRRWGHTGIQMLSPVPISTIEHTEGLDANISVLRCLRWQKFELSRRTSIREKFRQVNRSASNCLTSRSSKKKKKRQTKRKMRSWSMIPSQWWRIEWVISERRDRMWWWSLYLWNERLIISAEDFPCFGGSIRFNSKLCSVDFS